MTRPKTLLTRSQVEATLVTVLSLVLPRNPAIEYRLVGTAAALLHGVELPSVDVDLLVRTRPEVDTFAAVLTSFRCVDAAAWLPHARQYYCNYEVHGVEVGISTVEVESTLNTIETIGSGPWEHFVLLPCGRYRVPTVALELRLITEFRRGREDRYRPILSFMRGKEYDLDFVLRGLRTAGLSQSMQDEVQRELTNRNPA